MLKVQMLRPNHVPIGQRLRTALEGVNLGGGALRELAPSGINTTTSCCQSTDWNPQSSRQQSHLQIMFARV